jgi:hypothetical protein
MDRRDFVFSGTALAAASLTACGGGEVDVPADGIKGAANNGVVGKPTPVPVAYESFAGGADQPLSSTNWSQQNLGLGGEVRTNGLGQVKGQYQAQPGDQICTAVWKGAGDFSSDHMSEITLVNPNAWAGDLSRIGVTVRSSGVGSSRACYEVIIKSDVQNTPMTVFNKWLNNQRTQLWAGSLAWAPGDKLQLTCVGNRIAVEKNGVELDGNWVKVDTLPPLSPLLSGKPGISVSTGLLGDEWRAYKLVGGGVTLVLPTWVAPTVNATHYQVTELTKDNGYLVKNFIETCPPWHEPYRWCQITQAYSGGAWNKYHGEHGAMWYFGGGHKASNANSTVALVAGPTHCEYELISDGSKIFGNLTDPAGRDANSIANFYANTHFPDPNGVLDYRFTRIPEVDGSYSVDLQPGAPHSYNGLVVLPPTGPADALGTLCSPVLMGPGFNAANDASALSAWKLPLASGVQLPDNVLWSKFGHNTAIASGTTSWEAFAPPYHVCFYQPTGRIYIQGARLKVLRWVHKDTGEFGQSTGTPLDSVSPDNTANMAVHIPSRDLWVYLYRHSTTGFLKVATLDLTAAEPSWVNTGVTLALDIAVGINWCCAAWCEDIPGSPDNGKIVVADLLGNKQAVVEICLPHVSAPLTGTWACELVPMTQPITTMVAGLTTVNGNVYGKWSYSARNKCFLYANGHANSASVPDKVYSIRPRNV